MDQRRTQAGWRVNAAISAFAVVLAFGTLAWMEALHAHVLANEFASDSSHFVRDGMMLLPLSLAAALIGMGHSRRRASADLKPAAAGIAVAFAGLLVPAAAAHSALHDADADGVAHAGRPGDASAPAMAQESDGLASTLLHGAIDATLALPVAFVLSLGALVLLRRLCHRRALPAAPRGLLALSASTLVVAGAAAVLPVSEAASPDYPKFSMPLKIPPVLTGQNITIEMAQTEQQILPGNRTTMWTYNGSFPGPIIRRPTGEPTNVRFTNNLPPSAGSMSVHHHGTQAPEQDDGHPSNYLIAPGASKTYTYPGIDNGVPERAAPQWYHDHRDMVTGRNVWMGLVGAFIYDDPFERSLDLPEGPYDVPLLVTDREFDAGNQIPYTFVSSGNFGDVILVNGVPQPFYEVGDRRYRFRLYNTSNRRDYSFRLSNGQTMTQIGTDSGLLPEPVSRTSIRLGPAERADVVIDFAGHLNENIVLENGDAPFGPGERDAEVMQFRVSRDLTDDSSPVPDRLRPVFATDPPVTTRVWNFDRAGGEWTINGRRFDPERADARPVLGTTERWVFRNQTPLPHIAHVHLGDQKLVSRNGEPPPAYERVKESWYLAPGDEVVVDIKFSDYVGKFVFHCHVLEHEDQAMMTQFETLPAPTTPGNPQPDPAPGAPPAGAEPAAPQPSAGSPPGGPAALSRQVKILSSTRLSAITRRGLRFEAAAAANGGVLRADLSVRGRKIASVRRTARSRGRVTITLKLSRLGKQRLRRAMTGRSRATAVLTVRAGSEIRRARFTIRR